MRGPGEDKELVAVYLGAIAGDRQAREVAARELVSLAGRKAFAFFCILDASRVDEIANTAAMKALSTANPWCEGKGPFKAWFYKLVRNTVIDAQRSAGRHPPSEDIDARCGRSIEGGDETLAEMERDESVQYIGHTLLSRRESRAFELIAVEGMSQEEASATLEVAESTLREQWRAARDVYILKLAYLDKGMSTQQLSKWFVPTSTEKMEHERLRWALKHVRSRPGGVRIAERLISEKNWSVEEVAEAWEMPCEEVRRLIAANRALE